MVQVHERSVTVHMHLKRTKKLSVNNADEGEKSRQGQGTLIKENYLTVVSLFGVLVDYIKVY